MAGSGDGVEEVSDIAATAGRLVSSQSVLVQGADAAGLRTKDAISIGEHKSCKAVDTDRASTGIAAGSAIFSTIG